MFQHVYYRNTSNHWNLYTSWRWIWWWSRFDLKGNHRSIQTCCRLCLPIWLKIMEAFFRLTFIHFFSADEFTQRRENIRGYCKMYTYKRNSFREICVCSKNKNKNYRQKNPSACLHSKLGVFLLFLYIVFAGFAQTSELRKDERVMCDACRIVDRSRRRPTYIRLTSSISTGEWERSFFDSEMIV